MARVRDTAMNVLDFTRRRVLKYKDPVLSPTLVYTLEGSTSPIRSAAFLPDSVHLVSGSWDGTVRKWRITDGRAREVGQVMEHGSRVNVVAVSGDGKVLASGGRDGKVVFWDSEKLVESQEKHSRWINALSFAPDSQTLASRSEDGSIVVWSVLTGERIAARAYSDPGLVMRIAFSPAGDKIASSDGHICIWNNLLKEISPSISVEWPWSPDGRQLICGDVEGNIRFFDPSNGAPLATCRGHTNIVSSIVVSQGGTFFASASWDHTVRLWSTSTHQQLASLEHPDRLNAVSISSNGRYLSSVGCDDKMYIWRLPDFDQALQELSKQGSTSSTAEPPSGPQPAPLSSDVRVSDGFHANRKSLSGSVEHATPAQDRENDDDEPQVSGAPQGNHITRTASRESWLDMPAVAPAPVQTLPVEDGMFAEFFGADDPSAPQCETCDDRPAKWKRKAKESSQHLFKQFKHFCDGLLPRNGPSDMNNAPRPFSSQKLKDHINRIRHHSSIMPKNAERPAEERAPGQQGKNEPKSPKRRSSFVAYGTCQPRIAVASNDPPVQEKWHFAKRSGKRVRKPGPSIPDTSQGSQPTPSSNMIPSTGPTQGQGSTATPTTASVQARAQSPVSRGSDVQVCGCCGFFILARRG